VSWAIHHGPGVIKTGGSQAEIPANFSECLLAAGSNPAEQRGKRLIIEQISLAMPAPLVGYGPPLGILLLELEHVASPVI
jgi:hypothetical protein